VTRQDLIDKLSRENELTKAKSKKVVNQVFQSMTDTLAQGGRVEIRGFRSFRVKKYRANKGRNPRSGETVKVKAKKLPFFKVGSELRERVNNYRS